MHIWSVTFLECRDGHKCPTHTTETFGANDFKSLCETISYGRSINDVLKIERCGPITIQAQSAGDY